MIINGFHMDWLYARKNFKWWNSIMKESLGRNDSKWPGGNLPRFVPPLFPLIWDMWDLFVWCVQFTLVFNWWHFLLPGPFKSLKSLIKQMVFCYQNYSDLLWEKIVLVIEKNFDICGWRWRIYKVFFCYSRPEQFW